MMPAYSGRDDSLAVKLLTFYPEATSHETHQAWIMTFDPVNGNLTAVSEVSQKIVSLFCSNLYLKKNKYKAAIKTQII